AVDAATPALRPAAGPDCFWSRTNWIARETNCSSSTTGLSDSSLQSSTTTTPKRPSVCRVSARRHAASAIGRFLVAITTSQTFWDKRMLLKSDSAAAVDAATRATLSARWVCDVPGWGDRGRRSYRVELEPGDELIKLRKRNPAHSNELRR